MPSTSFKLLLALALLWLAVVPAQARRGYVRLRNGTVLEGHIRFESNKVVIVDAAHDLWAQIALTNLDALGFDAEIASPLATSAGPASDANEKVLLSWPWQSADIGGAENAGGGDNRRTTFRVRSNGTNVLGTSDSLQFVHKAVAGETEIIARLTRIQCADPWASAGLMLRESLAADSRQVFVALTPGRGGQLASRERTGGETSIELLPGAQPPAWLKLRRDGSQISAWRSRDGQAWTSVGRIAGAWPEEVYIGLAVVGGRLGMPSQAIFEHVEEAYSVRNRTFVPQIELASGSTQSGYISSLNETELRFESLQSPAISTPRVALIRLQPMRAKWAPLLASGRTGVLLGTGEFIEGDCRRIERSRVTVNSIPLGIRRYDVNHEVVAILLGRRAFLAPRNFEVRTADGALWLASEVTLDPFGVALREPHLGIRRISWNEILELRRAS